MSEPIKKQDDSEGQNPIWPGEKPGKPGTTERDDERGEETIVPVVQ